MLAKITIVIDQRYYYAPCVLELEHSLPVSLLACHVPRTIVLPSYASEGRCLLGSKTRWSEIEGWAMIRGGLYVAR